MCSARQMMKFCGGTRLLSGSPLSVHWQVLSSKFCLYDGVPLWVVNKSEARHGFPWPLAPAGDRNCSSRGWMDNILTQAAAQVGVLLYKLTECD